MSISISENGLIEKSTVFGAANTETVLRLPDGVGYADLDDASGKALVENIFGGAGLCNAVIGADALRSMRIWRDRKTVTFVGAVGAIDEDRIDDEAYKIDRFLKKRGINTLLQPIQGHPTEQTYIIISGDSSESRAALKGIKHEGDPLTRELFQVNDDVRDILSCSDLTVVSSLSHDKVIELGRARRQEGAVCKPFVWTLNKDSATAIATDYSTQHFLEEGCVDIIFASGMAEMPKIQREYKGDPLDLMGNVGLVVETRSKDGCVVYHNRRDGSRDTIKLAGFEAPRRVNDNGAGESHHNNFLATLIAAKNSHLFSDIRDIPNYVLEVAGNVANAAGAMKVQMLGSLDSPTFDYEAIATMMSDNQDPRHIAAMAMLQNSYTLGN